MSRNIKSMAREETLWVSFAYALFVAYIWTLPLWAHLADRNADSRLCGARVMCTDGGASFHHRTGSPFGCGCGQGILGQSACPVGLWGYTISGFIATAPGTGAMAALSAVPIASVWAFGTGAPSLRPAWQPFESAPAPLWLLRLARGSLVGFIAFYGVFLFGTYCIFEELHIVAVNLFACFALLHWWCVFHIYSVYYSDRAGARLVAGLSAVVVLGFGGFIQSGYLYENSHLRGGICSYLPWFCECVALSAGFAVAPVMLWHDTHRAPRYGAVETQGL